MPAQVTDLLVPIEALAPPEALGRVAYRGLQRIEQILSFDLPVARDEASRDAALEYVKLWRLVGDMAAVANRLLIGAGEGVTSARRDSALASLLEEIKAERAARVIEGG